MTFSCAPSALLSPELYYSYVSSSFGPVGSSWDPSQVLKTCLRHVELQVELLHSQWETCITPYLTKACFEQDFNFCQILSLGALGNLRSSSGLNPTLSKWPRILAGFEMKPLESTGSCRSICISVGSRANRKDGGDSLYIEWRRYSEEYKVNRQALTSFCIGFKIAHRQAVLTSMNYALSRLWAFATRSFLFLGIFSALCFLH